ncbi:MAG: DUF2442 domain-containing protein [Phycisphaerales bacterium]|nr:DUF2442 domain-containing protein [Phycisphaerales bacterium]
MFAQILKIQTLPRHRIRLTFADGVEGVIDISENIGRGGVFAPLKKTQLFEQVRITERGRAIEWPGQVDMCADALYLRISAADRKAS